MSRTLDPSLTPDQLRSMAAESVRQAQESWERSDTDGFLSQWASGLSAQLYHLEADIRAAGGRSTFRGLYSRTNPDYRIPAKIITTNPPWAPWTESRCWAILDPATGRFTGQFIPAFASDKVQAKHNVLERDEQAPARASIEGRGHGLSGQAWVAAVRTDDGWSEGEPV